MPRLIRPATPADVDAIVALAQSAYRGPSSRLGWTTEAHLLDGQRTDAAMVGELLRASRSVILVAPEGETLAGCVHVDAAGAPAHLGLLAVSPTRQAAGLGRDLLAAGEAHARAAWGALAIEIEVIHQRSELIAWYERRGYRRTGAVAAFPAHDPRFGRPLADDLHFVVLQKPLSA